MSIAPDPAMARLIADIRAPHEAMLSTELARTEGLLYRRGTFSGSLDDLICEAVLTQRDAEIALSPGFRWGPTLLPGQPITWDDVYNATAITYPAVYRIAMNGAQIKEALEGVADNLFYPDPYLQQGGDMVRVGGMGFTVSVDAVLGARISNMHLLRNGAPIEARQGVRRGRLGLDQRGHAGSRHLGRGGSSPQGAPGGVRAGGKGRPLRARRQLTPDFLRSAAAISRQPFRKEQSPLRSARRLRRSAKATKSFRDKTRQD